MNQYGEPWALMWGPDQYGPLMDAARPPLGISPCLLVHPHDHPAQRPLDNVVYISSSDGGRELSVRTIFRAVTCANLLAGVPDELIMPSGRLLDDRVQLALAVLRNPDDLAPLAALVDACLECLGGGAVGERCANCARSEPTLRNLCFSCITSGYRPHQIPVCQHCGARGARVVGGLCCMRRFEETCPREMP